MAGRDEETITETNRQTPGGDKGDAAAPSKVSAPDDNKEEGDLVEKEVEEHHNVIPTEGVNYTSTERSEITVMDRKPDLVTPQYNQHGQGDASGAESVKPDGGFEKGSGDEPTSECDLSITPGDTKDDQLDGAKAVLKGEQNDEEPKDEQQGAANIRDPRSQEGDEKGVNDGSEFDKETTTGPLHSHGVADTLGPMAEEIVAETADAEDKENYAGTVKYWILFIFVGLVAMLAPQLIQLKTPPEQKDLRQVDIFLREMDIVKTQFSSQHPELWKRSRIHLEKHLQTAHPTEPVSLILAAGHEAERTLYCLAQGLASAFSVSYNASVLHIDGASKANQDSDQVKLDIDGQLRGAFEGDKPAAVIHRFEELPPGSTLIFYRYCDHENAAYKKTFLIFTVLLEEEEVPASLRFSALEELVDDRLQRKFLNSGQSVTFDRMDLDKYSGLWSRISHLILPVARQESIERDGC